MKSLTSGLFALCVFAIALCSYTPDASAQGCRAGTPGCGAPAISQLNTTLANPLAINLPGASAAASTACTTGQCNLALQPAQVQFAPAQVRVQTTAPTVQYVQAPPQIQYVQAPPQVQYVQAPAPVVQYSTLPMVQFSTAPAAFAGGGGASASASASTSSGGSTLPLIAAQPAALVSGCSNGACGLRQRQGLQLRRPVSRSISISKSRG